MSNLRRKFKNKFEKKQNIPYTITGLLGNISGVVKVPNRNNYVYVRLAGSGIAEVFNNRVSTIFDLPVICGYDPVDPQRFQVLSLQGSVADAVGFSLVYGSGYAPSERYRWMYPGGGQDPLFVEGRQFMPLRITPTSELKFIVHNQVIWNGTEWEIFGGSTETDLASYVPTTAGKCKMVLISIDDLGDIEITAGSEVDITALVSSDIPSPPEGTRYVLGAIRLYTGQTKIQEARTNTDVVDLRYPQIISDSILNIEYSDTVITFPPTQSEIISIFGEPSSVGSGKLGVIDSGGENNNLYLVVSDGINWHCFPVSKTQVIGIQSLSSPNILFVGDGDKTFHTFQPCHETNIQEVDLGGYKYWAYYTTGVNAPNFEVHLARSNSLHSGWVDYGKVFDGRWPSVYYDGSTFHMIYREASVNLQLKYATSSDGISWTFQKNISTGNNPFLWKSPNDSNWYLFYHDTGGNGHRILYRAAATISGLDSATPTVLIDQVAIIASPSIAYYLNKYWLTCETYPDSVWNTVLYSSDAISGTYVEHVSSPILTNDDACAIQLLYNDVLYLYYSEKTGTGISWDYWDVVLRYATITAEGAVENLSRVIAFNDTQANIDELTGVLGELKFAYDSTNNLLGYSIDGINWYWSSNTSTDDDDAIHDNVDGEINAIAEKTSPVGSDILLGENSEDGYSKVKIQIDNLPIPYIGELLVDDDMNLLFDDNGDILYEE